MERRREPKRRKREESRERRHPAKWVAYSRKLATEKLIELIKSLISKGYEIDDRMWNHLCKILLNEVYRSYTIPLNVMKVMRTQTEKVIQKVKNNPQFREKLINTAREELETGRKLAEEFEQLRREEKEREKRRREEREMLRRAEERRAEIFIKSIFPHLFEKARLKIPDVSKRVYWIVRAWNALTPDEKAQRIGWFRSGEILKKDIEELLPKEPKPRQKQGARIIPMEDVFLHKLRVYPEFGREIANFWRKNGFGKLVKEMKKAGLLEE
ncbi:MAG: hypothetical protein DRO04_02900 [Candidatus Iainarchaeum archaeon]|uniref:Uncharacterized protein n=1 Tax=Candidatus Iainarchaeum sp. TaxID=3101447 RepID=A0A497JHC2_9ARCH|nr:MAG: hypothetical protein DRO04_02900 [Candidatus Diapherotrites archaeon]